MKRLILLIVILLAIGWSVRGPTTYSNSVWASIDATNIGQATHSPAMASIAKGQTIADNSGSTEMMSRQVVAENDVDIPADLVETKTKKSVKKKDTQVATLQKSTDKISRVVDCGTAAPRITITKTVEAKKNMSIACMSPMVV